MAGAGTGSRAAARAKSEAAGSRKPAAKAAAAPAAKKAPPKKKVWEEVEEAEQRKLGNRARAANGRRRQVAVVYDIEGPKVRLGILWFLLACGALVGGRWPLAGLYGAMAGLGGLQAARAWRRRGTPANPAVAAAIAVALPVAAAVSTAALGGAVLAAIAAAMVAGTAGGRTAIVVGARTLQSGLWVGGAAAGLVVSHRFEATAALGLVLVVSAYEIGDYLVGSGARNAIEGPVAGAAAALVVQFSISVIGLRPFTVSNGLGFAVLAAVLCPLGQLAASLVLPSVRAKAPAVRRLDSLILLAPVWALQVGIAAANAPR